MLDIDFFKEVNDNYGHLVGDYILKEFVKLIEGMIRKTDEISRYGGDEFILILYNCNEKQALSVMEKVRQAVEKHEFKYEDEVIKITVSIGIHKTSEDESSEEIVSKVDNKLYISKEKGRNTITV